MEAVLVLILACYFLPTLIAMFRRHHNTAAILVVDLFLGWTFLGWVVALAWSVSHTTPSRGLIEAACKGPSIWFSVAMVILITVLIVGNQWQDIAPTLQQIGLAVHLR